MRRTLKFALPAVVLVVISAVCVRQASAADELDQPV